MPREARSEADSSQARSPFWVAMGAGLVGVVFGGAAVYLGVAQRPKPAAEPMPAVAPAPAPPILEPPAVVTASAEVTADEPEPEPTLVDAIADTRDAVVSIGAAGLFGAGVIVDPQGTVITNYHVIADALQPPRGSGVFRDRPHRRSVTARFDDGRELSAMVVVADAEQDLAILRLVPGDEDERFDAVPLGTSAEVAVGHEVFAVGNPFGLSHTVSRGIVSAIDRSVLANRVPMLQLDASINVGNSGGPLFDLSGKLLGIVTAKNREGHGIAFAVPVDHLRGFLRAVADPESGGRSGAIGIVMEPEADLPEAVRDLGYAAGLVISAVDEGSPAATAGIEEGDVLVSIRGKRLDGEPEAGDPRALGRAVVSSVRSLYAGETLPVTVIRDGSAESLTIEVGAATADHQAFIDAEELLGLRLSGEEEGPPKIDAVLRTSPFAPYAGQLAGARMVTVMNRDLRSTEELGEELSRVRALIRWQQRAVQVRIGFAEADGSLLDEFHVVVG